MSANTLTAILPKILARGLMVLRERCVMPRLVNGDYSMDAKKKGATIDVPVPTAVSTIDVTPAETPPAATGLTPSTVQVQLNNWKQNSPIALTDKDIREIDRNQSFIPQQLDEAIRSLSKDVNDDIFAEYLGVYGWAGGSDAIPFNSTDGVLDAVTPRKVLNQQLAPKGNRRGVVDFDAEANMLALAAFSDAEKIMSAQVKTEGEIGRKYGIDWIADEAVPTHTTGTLSNGSEHKAKFDGGGSPQTVGAESMDIDETTLTGTVVPGDIFTVAGDDQTYVVTNSSTLTAASNAISGITFAPAAKVAWADDAVVTFKDSHKVNLVFHRDAFAFAMRSLDDLQGLPTDGRNLVSMQDPVTGLVMRLEVSRQHKQTAWEFDILWGAKLVRPELACRLAGST